MAAEKQKKFRVVFQGKKSLQYMTLMARNKEEAHQLAERAQYRRHERFPLAFERLEESRKKKTITLEQFKAEVERRKRDQARYDDGELKIKSVEEAR